MSPSFLKVFLRIIGSASLCAVFAVLMPYHSMNVTHEWLGLGELPHEPIVGYLARSTSAFYTLFGALMWIVSFDLSRHRTIIRYLGCAIVLLGVTLLAVDTVEGLPRYWIVFEGPANMAIGGIILYSARRLT
ncbi:MAG: hypothetical protein GY953_46240 [bacterium]|nr:hypothetical protein [bacterium]